MPNESSPCSWLCRARYPDDDRVASFYSTLQSALEERLGPRSVAIVDEIPLTGDRGRGLVRDQPADDGREAVVRSVSPGYFDVMDIPTVAFRRRCARRYPRRILRATLGQTALLVGAGLAVGGVLSIWTSRALGSLVLATGGFDALLSVALPTTVVVAISIAAVLPAARRAARTDPSTALRGE